MNMKLFYKTKENNNGITKKQYFFYGLLYLIKEYSWGYKKITLFNLITVKRTFIKEECDLKCIIKDIMKINKKVQVWFDHTWGGGAEIYLKRKFIELQKKDFFCIRIQNNGSDYIKLSYRSINKIKKFYINSSMLFKILVKLDIFVIVINNLASYKDILKLLDDLSCLKHKINTKIIFLCHDFLCVCPTINLVNQAGVYCDIQNIIQCNNCLKYNQHLINSTPLSIYQWRQKWESFLYRTVDDIIVFSQSSYSLLESIYPKIKYKIKIIPHEVPSLRRVIVSKHQGINIAVIGNITYHKGLNVVEALSGVLNEYKDVKIVIIGSSIKKFYNIKQTGPYQLSELPSIVKKNNIDIVLIPSIWPETFSYTTSEAINMSIPVACFNMGAQAEKVKKYSKGLIINNIEPNYIINSILNFLKNNVL